jgi:hypothetical protein
LLLVFLRTSSITFAGIPFLERGCPPEESHHPLGDRQVHCNRSCSRSSPNHLVLPALPDTTNWWSELETAPIVAEQVNKINLVSPEGILIVMRIFRLLPLIEQMFQQNEQLQLLALVLTQYKKLLSSYGTYQRQCTISG